MRIYTFRRRGYTLFEVLIASVIMLIAVGAAITLYIACMTYWNEGIAQINLQRKAGAAMEKMVRGVNGKNGIREGAAGTIVIVGNDIIEVDVDMNDPPTPSDPADDTTISFYKSGSQIFYDPDKSVSGNEFSIAENVVDPPSGQTFTASGDLVTINLSMEDTVVSKQIDVDITTRVELRN